MEIKEIHKCQEILDSVKVIDIKEAKECDKLLRDKGTLDWLTQAKNNVILEIKAFEDMILKSAAQKVMIKDSIEQKRKEQVITDQKIKDLGQRVGNLVSTEENHDRKKAELINQLNEIERKIEDYEYDINLKRQSTEAEVRHKEQKVKDLRFFANLGSTENYDRKKQN